MPALSRQRGFTLIEVMITLAIIAILAAVSAGIYTSFVANARCSEVETVAYDTMTALVQAYSETSVAPPASGFNSTQTINGQVLNYPPGVEISFSGGGTDADPFIVQGTRTNPVCPKGDGTYVLQQGQLSGQW